MAPRFWLSLAGRNSSAAATLSGSSVQLAAELGCCCWGSVAVAALGLALFAGRIGSSCGLSGGASCAGFVSGAKVTSWLLAELAGIRLEAEELLAPLCTAATFWHSEQRFADLDSRQAFLMSNSVVLTQPGYCATGATGVTGAINERRVREVLASVRLTAKSRINQIN